MRSLSAGALLNRRGEAGYDLALATISAILALTVFYVDTYTNIESAIAVLYVIVLLLCSEILTRRGLVVAASLCAALAIGSYIHTHLLHPELQPFLRLVVSMAALTITTILLLRNEAFRGATLSTNAALRDSEMRYRSIFNRTRVALWERDYSRARTYLLELKSKGVVDLKQYFREHADAVDYCIGLVTTVASNDAAYELLGDIATDRSSGSMRRFIAPGDKTFIDLMEAIFEGRDHFEGKGTVTAESGESKLVLLSIGFPEDPAAFNRVIVGMIDITQREQTQTTLLEARAELTRASRAAVVGAMSASLAHELNQPLGAIVVNSQTLLRWLDRDPPDLGAVRRTVDRLIRDSERARLIIQNTRSLLTQADCKMEWIDLTKLVEETRALMEHDLQRDFVMVDVSEQNEIPKVRAVRIELQQVLINLMTNSIQAMAAEQSFPRKLTISLGSNADGDAVIAVQDNGPGITEQAAPRLFSPFYTTKVSGMGMGLSICKSTLEARGGQLIGYNHPDRGAIFEITIPIEAPHV
ncbi:ATP-binding protein [Rhizobium tubonense]|uniref:histidine kinase n=1 Tax=Rhizobium tubonense TaxID=484088 RepID=A0A2W4C9E5_9HYPH|nr:ATP-binding protein [Rhizobium tubonense]PZM07998.1 two-component sensor histidine kinase [Rhizobium tubonense]